MNSGSLPVKGDNETEKCNVDLHLVRHLSHRKGHSTDLVQDAVSGRVFVIVSLPRVIGTVKITPATIFASYGFRHPTISSFHSFFLPDLTDGSMLRAAISFYSNGSLAQMLEAEQQGKHPITWNNTQKSICAYGIAYALKLIHETGAIHGHLTPSQVFLTSKNEPAVSGHWLFTLCDNHTLDTPESQSFLAEEDPSKKSDVFSYGAILCAMKLHKIKYEDGDEDLDADTSLNESIKLCLNVDPAERPEIDAILKSIEEGKLIFSGTDQEELKDYVQWIKSIEVELPETPTMILPKIADDKDVTDRTKELADYGNVQAQLLNGIRRREGTGCSVNKNAALRSFRAAADGGNPEAQFCASVIMGAKPKNAKIKQESLRYLEMAAEGGFPEAQFKYGTMIQYGDSFSRNVKRAEKFLSAAADSGLVEAQIQIANLYKTGFFGSVDNEKAMKYFEMAAKACDVQAQYEFSKYVFENDIKDKKKEAQQFLHRAALQNNEEAVLLIAKLLANGEVTIDNTVDELDFVKRASNAGQEEAKKYYSHLITNNKIQPKDLKSAAESGNSAAMVQYAKCLLNGTDEIKQDKATAINYFRTAADSFNNAEAAYFYAENLMKNRKGWSDDALRYMKMAADGNYPEAQRYYAILCIKRKALPNDYYRFAHYCKAAADAGDAKAQRMYAEALSDGYQVQADPSLAFKYFEMAANQNSARALYALAVMYENGDGCKANKALAKEYMEKAAKSTFDRSSFIDFDAELNRVINPSLKTTFKEEIESDSFSEVSSEDEEEIETPEYKYKGVTFEID